MPEATENTPQDGQQPAPNTADATGTNGGEQQPTQQSPAAEKTFTQADIDRIVTERLAKERTKSEAAVKKAQEDAARKQAEEQGKYEQLYKETQAKLEQAEARTRAAELATLRRQVADKIGLPATLAERLHGETAEDLEADAKTLLASLPKPAAPNLNNEPGAGGKPANGQMSEAEKANLASILGVNPKYLSI
jgi:hypothetical protein